MKPYKILLLAAIFLVSCGSTENDDEIIMFITPDNSDIINNNTPVEKTKTYLALGDSYTKGQGVSTDESFPYILVNALNQKNKGFKNPIVIAETGWTTTNLLNEIDKQNSSEKFDLVTLLIGVNNQFQGKNIETYRTEFITLLNQAIDFADYNLKNVIVISIPDWSVSPYATSANVNVEKVKNEIDAYNAIKREETLKKGVQFVNITTISRSAYGNISYFANDGLHFSGAMHKLWVNEMLELEF